MVRKLETKDLEFKFTMTGEEAEAGVFKGYASVFDAEDSFKCIVDKGAFKKTIRERKEFPVLWFHDVTKPVGLLSGQEDDAGFYVAGQLNLDVQLGREARSLIKQKVVKGLSIGFQAIKEFFDKETGIRHLKEINLWEVSLCSYPACPGAVVRDIKSETEEPDSSTPIIKPGIVHLVSLLDGWKQDVAGIRKNL